MNDKMSINEEYDYSNIIVEKEPLDYLVKYLEQIYLKLVKLFDEDIKTNEKLEYELRNYNYKKSYNSKFEILVNQKRKALESIKYTNYNSFKKALDNGEINNVSSILIDLNLSFKKGKEYDLIEHENSFKIVFKPYDIKLIRNSNYNEDNMNEIEEVIKKILNNFRKQNTIFCTK